jgi:large repetitive protein
MRNAKLIILLMALLALGACDKYDSPIGITPPPVESALVINEFMADNASYADENGNFGDWIEIFNGTDSEVDIAGYYITDDLAIYDIWQIPTGDESTIIPSGGHLILWADKDPTQGVLHVNIKLGSSGEAIGLYDDFGAMIDEYTFGAQELDVSEGRETDGSDNWVTLSTPSPGLTNYTQPSIAGELQLNEFMASNATTYADENGEFDDWIEIYNGTDTAIDLGGYFITDDLVTTDKWQIPTGDSATIIPAGGYLILWADKEPDQGVLHVNIKLGSGGEDLGLFDPNGLEVDAYTFGPQIADISEGKDVNGEWVTYESPTPGASNF